VDRAALSPLLPARQQEQQEQEQQERMLDGKWLAIYNGGLNGRSRLVWEVFLAVAHDARDAALVARAAALVAVHGAAVRLGGGGVCALRLAPQPEPGAAGRARGGRGEHAVVGWGGLLRLDGQHVGDRLVDEHLLRVAVGRSASELGLLAREQAVLAGELA
jgi:hypothetical protein